VSATLAELRFVEEAEVRKAGRRAGLLRRTPGGSEFAYDADYDGPAVAWTLPLGQAPVLAFAGAVPPFFAGLLPEGRRLTAIRRALKTSADDDFALLLAVGHEAIGDVQVVPVGWTAPAVEAPALGLDDVRFADLMNRVLGPEGADRLGLPGVQDKVSGGMISLPVHLHGAPCILKLNPPDFPHLVENEAFFLEAARSSGLRVTEAEVVHDAEGTPGLLVQRFDRVHQGGQWRALAQEDACQVLGRYPADKYRLSAEQVVQGLSSVTGAPAVSARELLRQLAFAYLSCNGDAHAKNFSVRRAPDGEWEVTPAYDLPSSHPYGDHSLALRLNGKDRDDIGRKDFLALGAAAGLPPRAVERVLDELVDRAPGWLEGIEALPFDERRVHKLRRACSYRCERLGG